MNSGTIAFPKNWKDAIEKSGKFFEQDIATMVSESSFGFVIPNYAFVDIEAGISREMDIFAISGHKIGRKWNFVFPILLISISNKPLTCFTRNDYVSSYTSASVQFSGMPKKAYRKGEEIELFEFFKLDKFHHYYKTDKISSQFWTPLEKNETQGDYFYKELVLPLIKAVIAEKKEQEKDWSFDPRGEPINLQLYYPIIVVKDLWECNFTKDKVVYSKTDSLIFLFHTASEGYAGDYLIDICTKDGLKQILKKIEAETKRIVDSVSKNRKLLENSALKDAKERRQKLPNNENE